MNKFGVITSPIDPYDIVEIRGESEKYMQKSDRQTKGKKNRIGYYACQ